MDILGWLFSGELRAGVPSPIDNYWYEPISGPTPAGMRVDTDTAQKLSAWYRGRDILATVLAMSPLQLFERLPDDGGSTVARDQGLYDVLHDQPNEWQDSFQWRRQKMYHIIDHGNAYDWILPGARGFVDQLQPIKPTLVTPRQVTSGAYRGRLLYDVRDEKTGQSTTHTQDEIFHLRGASDDGVKGRGILEAARTSLGTALATESYAAQIFGRGTLNGGVIETPGAMEDEERKKLAQQFVTKNGQWHVPKVLVHGAKWSPNTMTPEDAQMLLSRKHSVDDIARWLGVPRQMLENSDPSFGNAEQFDQSFLTYSMGEWFSLFEFAINHQLVVDRTLHFAEFKRDAFMRAKFLERAQGNVLLKNAGIISADEVRAVEGKNTRGGKADDLVEPQNITGKPAGPANSSTPTVPDNQPTPKKAQAIVVESAARVLRKEIAAVQKLAVRHAADADAFATAITGFYADHAGLIAQTLQMSTEDAAGYCAGQAAQVLSGWIAALETWKTDDYAAGLAALALDEAA